MSAGRITTAQGYVGKGTVWGEENHNEHKACITAAIECSSHAGSQREPGKTVRGLPKRLKGGSRGGKRSLAAEWDRVQAARERSQIPPASTRSTSHSSAHRARG
jgi:hypothetical protein